MSQQLYKDLKYFCENIELPVFSVAFIYSLMSQIIRYVFHLLSLFPSFYCQFNLFVWMRGKVYHSDKILKAQRYNSALHLT